MSNEFINLLTKKLMDSCFFLTVLTALTIIIVVTLARLKKINNNNAKKINYANIILVTLTNIANIFTLALIIYCHQNKLPLELTDVLLHIICFGAAIHFLNIVLKQKRILTEMAENE